MKHFVPSEFVATNVSCANVPATFDIVRNIVYVASRLDEIREKFGAPIVINSGYRTAEVNKAVGGVVNSWHTKGLAVDIRPSSYQPSEFRGELERLNNLLKQYSDEIEEIVYYSTFTHVAWKSRG